jgi:hypothetical protein
LKGVEKNAAVSATAAFFIDLAGLVRLFLSEQDPNLLLYHPPQILSIVNLHKFENKKSHFFDLQSLRIFIIIYL